MIPDQDLPNDDELRREFRRLGWGLVVYLLLVLGIGAGAVRLALTHRHFQTETMAPAPVVTSEPSAVDSTTDDSGVSGEELDSESTLQTARGEVPQ
ncbi:MAG TPA: hypothetical protein VEI47_01560 [Gemmatimonadales bacterium]|nr:hypothetical protein [Gemmatimonadales bacterium]